MNDKESKIEEHKKVAGNAHDMKCRARGASKSTILVWTKIEWTLRLGMQDAHDISEQRSGTSEQEGGGFRTREDNTLANGTMQVTTGKKRDQADLH